MDEDETLASVTIVLPGGDLMRIDARDFDAKTMKKAPAAEQAEAQVGQEPDEA